VSPISRREGREKYKAGEFFLTEGSALRRAIDWSGRDARVRRGGFAHPAHAKEDLTFSNEPGIYIRGEFGIRLEDDMQITADGAKLFLPQSEPLEKPF
jgi:hypothetical protein